MNYWYTVSVRIADLQDSLGLLTVLQSRVEKLQAFSSVNT